MSESKLAENICLCHAKTIVDQAGGITLGGQSLARGYADMWAIGYDTHECEQALIHWVVSAGYDENGDFKFTLSNNKQNC